MRKIIGSVPNITSAGRFVPVGGQQEANESPGSYFGRSTSRNDNAYAFEPSPEAQAYLDEMRRRYGYDIEVRPNVPGDAPEGAGGYFNPMNPEGGSADPSKRVVHLSAERPEFYTLMHEVGHATDPTLLKEVLHEGQLKKDFFERTGNNIGRPVDYLSDYLFSMGPRSRFRTELTAEEAAKFSSEEFGLRDSSALDDKAEYPFTYITQGIEDFERVYTAPNVPDEAKKELLGRFHTPGFGFQRAPLYLEVPVNANTVIDASDDHTRRALGLALDREYQQEKNFELNRAIDYAKRRLGDATNLERYYR